MVYCVCRLPKSLNDDLRLVCGHAPHKGHVHGVCGYAPQWEVDIPHSGIKQALDLIKRNYTQKSIENNTIIYIF